MAVYLLVTERGIETTPVVASSDAELLAALQEVANGHAVKVAAIQLDVAADMAADGSVPAAFTAAQLNRAALIAKATAALTVNTTFLALPAPTNLQVLAQVQSLTRQMNALIRLAANQLDSTQGT